MSLIQQIFFPPNFLMGGEHPQADFDLTGDIISLFKKVFCGF